MGYSSQGHKESDTTEATEKQQCELAMGYEETIRTNVCQSEASYTLSNQAIYVNGGYTLGSGE